MLKIGVEFYFGAKKVNDFLKIPIEKSKRVFIYAAEEGGGRLCLSLARQTCTIAREALLTAEYDPARLEDPYLVWKVKHGYAPDLNTPRIGFMTNMMFENLSFFRTGDRYGWVVGYKTSATGAVGQGLINEVKKTALTDYAYYFEFGNKNQVKRPWLRYSLDKMMRENYKKTVVEEFIKPFTKEWWQESWRSG